MGESTEETEERRRRLVDITELSSYTGRCPIGQKGPTSVGMCLTDWEFLYETATFPKS